LWACIYCVVVVVVGTRVGFGEDEVSCPLAALVPEQYTSTMRRPETWVFVIVQ